MSNHLISTTYKRDLRTPMRKSVMALLADKASDDGAGIYASKQTMADELCCSKQAIIDTIKGFVSEGLLVELGQRRVVNGHTVEYGIDVDALEALPLVRCHAERAKRGSTPLTGQRAGPVKQAGRSTSRTPPVNQVDPNPSGTLPLETSGDVSAPDPAAQIEAEAEPPLTPEEVIDAWNETAGRIGLSKARLTPARRKKLNVRIREHSMQDFTEAIAAITRSPFLRGENPRGWRADFDFFLQPSSFVRLIEGSFDNGPH